jgi:hypothetical protein
VVILWTHCRRQASDREEKRNSPGTREGQGPKKTKNDTNEASMSLKTNEAFRKRTQNEPQLSAQMREINPKFELIDGARVGAVDWIVGDAAGTGVARLAETRGTAREYKNNWNKARMLMKTKHITFLSGANQRPSARQSAPIRP